jgi:N-acetylmuramoyl-L-alanine amidase
MKYGIDKGHNCIHNTGAEGIKFEDNLTRAVGEKLIEYLRQLGHTVTDCTPATAADRNEALYLRTTVANRDNVDQFISIHFNAGGGHGSEIYCVNENMVNLGNNILSELEALGFTNRGIQYGGNLYVIRNTNMPAMLIEVAFVDSQEDMDRVDNLGIDTIAKAIVKGLTGQCVNDVVEGFDPIQYMMSYRDLVEAYSKDNHNFIEFATWHYENYGKYEIAEGKR